MMITCKRAADLLCQGLDRPLSCWQRWQLRVHLWMCRPCAAFARQNEVILDLIAHRFQEVEPGQQSDPQLERLSREACERLKRRLREATDGHGREAARPDEHPRDQGESA